MGAGSEEKATGSEGKRVTRRQLGATCVLCLHQMTPGVTNLVLCPTKTRLNLVGCADHRVHEHQRRRWQVSTLDSSENAVILPQWRGSSLLPVLECGQPPSLFCVIWGLEKKGKFSVLNGVSSQRFQEPEWACRPTCARTHKHTHEHASVNLGPLSPFMYM